MYLQEYDDEYRIRYTLQERDSSGDITIRTLSAGFFGGLGTGTVAWNVGENVLLGAVLVGNEVWFYTTGYDTLVKVQILIPFTPNDGSV